MQDGTNRYTTDSNMSAAHMAMKRRRPIVPFCLRREVKGVKIRHTYAEDLMLSYMSLNRSRSRSPHGRTRIEDIPPQVLARGMPVGQRLHSRLISRHFRMAIDKVPIKEYNDHLHVKMQTIARLYEELLQLPLVDRRGCKLLFNNHPYVETDKTIENIKKHGKFDIHVELAFVDKRYSMVIRRGNSVTVETKNRDYVTSSHATFLREQKPPPSNRKMALKKPTKSVFTVNVRPFIMEQLYSHNRIPARANGLVSSQARTIQEREAEVALVSEKVSALQREINSVSELEGGKVLNPATKRYVKVSGRVGRAVLSSRTS